MSKVRTSQRRPRDAEKARETLLDAAEAVFAEHGFAGARIDAIAAAAGYNKSLIFQYFGDKLGLYTAILKRVDEQATRLGIQVLESFSPDSPITIENVRVIVEQAVRVIFDYVVAHPRALRILAWEEAEGWTTLAKIHEQLDHRDVDLFLSILERARQAGVLRPDVSPRLFLMLLTNVCRSYVTSLPVFAMVLSGEGAPSELSSPGAEEQARNEITAFVVHGLIADPVE